MVPGHVMLKLKSRLITVQPVTGAKNVSTAPTEPANNRPLGEYTFGAVGLTTLLVPVYLNSRILPVSLVDPPLRPTCVRRLPNTSMIIPMAESI